MKAKFYLIAAAACAALAACSKNEVAPVDVDQEITYQTIETKAASGFKDDNKFSSYAYFIPKGQLWDSYTGSPSSYISGATISYDKVNYKWKASNTYYWPKQGSLTFFAWSMNDDNAPAINGDATVSSPANKGITVTGYDITQNRNRDFLVAEIAKDMKSDSVMGNHEDENSHTWANGVPTVFKHALSKLVFKVQTVKGGSAFDYGTSTVFDVKEIKLSGVETKANYAQEYQAGTNPSKHTWSDWTAENNAFPVFTGSKTASESETQLAIGGSDYSLVIPQNFTTGNLLTIKYTITTNYAGGGSPVVENVEQTKDLTEIYTSNWESGKIYTLVIKLGLDEIYWDPDVTDWVPGATSSITF